MIWIILELKEYRILSPQVTPAEVPTGRSPGMQTGQGSIKARLDMDGRSSRFWAFFLSITQPTGVACKGSRRCGHMRGGLSPDLVFQATRCQVWKILSQYIRHFLMRACMLRYISGSVEGSRLSFSKPLTLLVVILGCVACPVRPVLCVGGHSASSQFSFHCGQWMPVLHLSEFQAMPRISGG